MSGLSFQIDEWLASSLPDAFERETLASLRITTHNQGDVTEVEDLLAHTVRQHVNVCAGSLARWLLVNWWRLRWEPDRSSVSSDWVHSHCMASVGDGYAWPALTFSSDGEFVQVRLDSDASADVAPIRYLRDLTVDVPAAAFERAIDEFVEAVNGRLAARLRRGTEVSDLAEELREERASEDIASACRLQALAGLDPGSVPEDWLHAVRDIAKMTGAAAADEVVAASASFPRGLVDARSALEAIKDAKTEVNLQWGACVEENGSAPEIPWMRGARLAHVMRQRLGLASGPITKHQLEEVLEVRLPLGKTPWTNKSHLLGGFRRSNGNGRTALVVTKIREDSQRFYLARLIGAACVSGSDEHLLAVSDAATAFQKYERSFAQEFLCPWEELDAFTDDVGTDQHGVEEAAEYFMVSEYAILTTLVNRGKIPRWRLAR